METEQMIHKNIEYIFLDVGYTLCYPKSGSWRFTPLFYELVDRTIFESIPDCRKDEAENIANQFLFSKHKISTQQEEYQQNLEAYSIIANRLPELSLSYNSIERIAYDRTYNMENYAFYDGVNQLIAWLSDYYKIGIISDAWPSSNDLLKHAGLWDYIDTCTLSCDIGICKPNMAIYKKAISDALIDPEKAVFVDDVEENLIPAYQLGMWPIKVRTVDKSKSKFYAIDNITELGRYLSPTL